MKLRNVAVDVMVGGLVLSTAACGKSGSPTAARGIEPPPAMTVAKNVNITGSPTFDRIKQNKKITIGVKDDQPGIGYKDPTTKQFSGFDINIALYLAGQLGFSKDQVTFQPVPSSSREAVIQNNQVDLVVASYTINDKRKQQVSFAGPYVTIGQDLLVRKDDNSITGPQSLKGKKVCSVTGSTPIQYVREHQLTEPGNIVELQKYTDCVSQLESKKVDTLTTDNTILQGYAAQEPDKLKVVDKPFTTEQEGVGLAKDDKVLRGKLDDFLQKALDDGSWQKFYDATLGKSGSKPKKPTIERY